MVFNCNMNKRFSACDIIGLLSITLQIIPIRVQGSCLQTNGNRLPFFQGYDESSNEAGGGGPNRRIHHQHQAIIPSYRFDCCGNITEWGVDLNPDRDEEDRTFDFILQVWRPSLTTNQPHKCYSLVNDHKITSTVINKDLQTGRVAKVTSVHHDQLQFQPGDVLGFYVESHGSGDSDSDNGVVLLNNGTHTSELVWFARVNTTTQTSQYGSCPYPVGTNGVLISTTHAAPVISISVMSITCFSNYSSIGSIPSTSLPNPTRMVGLAQNPHSTGTNTTIMPGSRLNGTMNSGLIAGVIVAILIVVSITIVMVLIIVKRHSMTKQADDIGMALSNQVYNIPEGDQLNITYACPDSTSSDIPVSMTQRDNAQCTSAHMEKVLYHSVGPDTAHGNKLDSSGLYAVNPVLNEVNQYSEVANQYAEVGLEGQESRGTGRSGECKTSSHNEEAMANEIDLFNMAGVYVPTTEERSNQEGHYEMQNMDNHIYNKLTFFVKDKIYWAPASTTSDLYSQLASKKYREIPREHLRMLTELGSGEFGNVCKAVWSISGTTKEVAVKTLKQDSSENDRVRFLQEAAIMGQFNHPHVVNLYGVVTVEDPIIICFELMVNGNLRDYLGMLSPNSGVLKELELQLLRFSRQIASGMAYLSKKAFVHRDLAARNILLDEALTCKISDFGMARDLADSAYYTVRSKGGKIPVKWTAPEALFYKKYSTDSDVWSYGMVLFEIWSVGKKPFSELSNSEVLRKINSGYCQRPPPGCPRPIYQLMVDCWNPIHSQRPSFSKISATLNASSSTLLQLTGDDRSVAGELGGQLSKAQLLYQDLQNCYLQKI